MKVQFLTFLSIIGSFLILASLYLGTRFIQRTDWGGSHRSWVWLLLSLFVVLQFVGPWLYRSQPELHRLNILLWVVYTTLGIFVSLLFFYLVADFIGFLWKWLFTVNDPVNFDRRNFISVGALTLGASAIGLTQARLGPTVEEVDIPIEGLPKDFEGFRIAQISDLHVGPTIGLSYVEDVVKKVNFLKADLVALTGDFIDGSVDQLSSEIAPLAKLESKHGIFFVTGNHEYYWGVEEWLKEFRKLGFKVLQNEHVLIQEKTSEIILAGVTDISAGSHMPGHFSDPKKSLANAPLDRVKILLAHQPASFKNAAEAGFDLQLSGHTHGGQFFPFNLIVKLVQPFYRGLNRFGKMWIYVNRGTGYWGPPLRLAVPSEITLVRLKSV